MNTNSWQAMRPDVTIKADCDYAIAQVMLHLAADDIMVRRPFDLDSACASLAHNVCPHAGHAPCECRLAVLILLDRQGRVATLVAHADRGLTEFYLVDSSDLYPKPDFDAEIRATLATLRAGANSRSDEQWSGDAGTAGWW